MAKKIKQSTEAELKKREDSNIKAVLDGFHPYPPISKQFEVGEMIQYGAHPNAEVLEIFDGGRCLKLRVFGTYEKYGKPYEDEFIRYTAWDSCSKLSEKTNDTTFKNDTVRLNYADMDIDSMIHAVYNFGVDFNPFYQREYVWTAEDKELLIDSIYNNRTIGSYVLCHLGYNSPISYEILDGKQRCRALLDFFEDKFTYKGKLFSELSWQDKHHFENFKFPRAEVKEPTDKQKIEIFIHVNTTGMHMSKEHLDKVQAMLYTLGE